MQRVFLRYPMNQHLISISRYLKSHDFKRSVVMTATIFVCGFSLHYLGLNKYIIGICVGIFLTSISDIQGSFRHRNLAMVASLSLNLLITLSVNLIHGRLFLLILFICVAAFFITYLSVFGNRASFFSMSSLLALVFSLIRIYEGQQLLYHLLAIFIGGCIYLLVSSCYHWLTRKQQTNQKLGELAALTAQYLTQRTEIAKQGLKRPQQSLFNLQVEIINMQDELRNLILADRQNSGQSRSRNRQMLILIELIDIMELVVANPVPIQSTFKSIKNPDNYLPPFIKLSTYLAVELDHLSKVLLDNKPLRLQTTSVQLIKDTEESIQQYVETVGLPKAREGALAMRNLLEYFRSQSNKINSLERLLSNVQRQKSISLNKKQYGRFLSKEDYSPQILTENFHIKSQAFRHALRLSCAMLIGYSLGKLLNVSNAYWILLTIVVIMRPNFGLTKERSIKRVVGTLIGVFIAAGIILITQNQNIFLVIIAISTVLSFSLIQRNYTIAATAITLNVVFIFSLLQPDLWDVIQFRLIDTIIGASVAIAVNYIIIPNWEAESFEQSFTDVLASAQLYLKEIAYLYRHPSSTKMNYRLSRKEAYTQISELNASFQRYTQDPKSKQKKYAIYYDLMVLSQSLLSTLSNLGNYLQQHENALLSEQFESFANNIKTNIQTIEKQILRRNFSIETDLNQAHQAIAEVKTYWEQIAKERDEQIEAGQHKIDKSMRENLQQIQFIQNEMSWLVELTQSIQKKVAQLS